MELKRVVVTGLGAITPIGNTAEEFWNGLIKYYLRLGIVSFIL